MYLQIEEGVLKAWGDYPIPNWNKQVDIDYKDYIKNPDKYIFNGETIVLNPNYEAEQEAKEKERIAQLNMTRGDFFEGLILSVGKDEDDVLALIDVIDLTETERKIYKSRVKNALDFYRGYPLIDVMCGYLGINPDSMTLFFETKDYTHLIPIPEEPTVPETEEPDGEIPNDEVGDTTTTDTTTV